MANTVFLKALGLNTQPNQIDIPDGSMVMASNVILRRDNVIEPRRGFKLYGDSFGTSSDRTKQLFAYKQRILRHYATTLQFDDGEGDFSSFNGTYTEAQTGLRMRSIEANGNFYFTTSEGIKKISAKTAADFTTAAGYIVNAGGVKALDLEGELSVTLGSNSGFLPANSAVAYRTVWGYKDANNNLILGTPSEREEVYNPTEGLIVRDLFRLAEALDNIDQSGSLITDGNYVSTLNTPVLGLNADGSTLKTKVVTLAEKLDDDLILNTGNATVEAEVITTTTARVKVDTDPGNEIATGDYITLSGFTSGGLTQLNGRSFLVTNVAVSGGDYDISLTLYGTPALVVQANTADVGGVINSFNYGWILDNGSTAYPTALNDLTVDTPATGTQLEAIQDTISRIITQLQTEPTDVIDNTLQTEFIDPLGVTTTVNVNLTFTIPPDVPSTVAANSYFYQIYRSSIVTATETSVLSDLVPNDELQLVYEAFPTQDELTAKSITIEDVTPDAFRGANLYTNATTGEGILQANDLPPFAIDIARYKGYTFYANTRTRHREFLNLLGVQRILDEITAGRTPTITITNGTTTNTYTFVTGVQEITPITVVAKATVPASGYFTINSPKGGFRFWYDTTGTDPAPASGGNTLVRILIDVGGITTDSEVANKTRDVINTQVENFTATASGAIVTITNVDDGSVTDAALGTGMGAAGFSIGSITQGRGENVASKQILVSDNDSPAIAVDETARSIVRVLNQTSGELVDVFYLSGASDVPGKMLMEARDLSTTPFYILSNNGETGISFNPDISPSLYVAAGIAGASITVANPTVITVTSHGLTNGDQVVISGSINANPDIVASIDGLYTATVINANTFSIPVNVTTSGAVTASTIGVIPATDASISDNEVKPNRVYFSKFSQPEAVPIVNFIDLGAEDDEIMRIFTLRDSLFVFKEDGLYRISGEVSPFTQGFFEDCILVAPDSLDILDNLLYGWTRQGIQTISESGVEVLSRPIDIDLLPLSSNAYENFSTATWGMSYDSDNSYTIYTVSSTEDTRATIGYRFSNLTNSFTTIDKTATCGLINPVDDKMYLGAGDTNFIEQERKNFNRTDYADREIEFNLAEGNYYSNGAQLQFSDVSDIEIGDVFTQEQLVSIYQYNMLLQKLDLDPVVGRATIIDIGTGTTVAIETSGAHNLVTGNFVELTNTDCSPTIDGTYEVTVSSSTEFTIEVDSAVTVAGTSGFTKLLYYDSLLALGGDDMRENLEALAAKLDTDPGVNDTDFASTIANKTGTITAISAANPTVISDTSHGLFTDRVVTITGTNSSPVIDGIHQVTVLTANTFSIPEQVITAGTTGSWETDTSDFRDLLACFNKVVDKLNNDSTVAFSNYQEIDTETLQEAIISNVNRVSKTVTMNVELPFIVGELTLYKAINTELRYTPQTMGDPLGLKHLREATIMFENSAFTSAIMNFSTDLLPGTIEVPFNQSGNGIFGHAVFGLGFFGGAGNSAPFRTYIPRTCQRCRFINIGFEHRIAREKYSIFGVSITGEVGQSSRAYR